MSRCAANDRAARGFSVVELMVAMTLSLILLAGVLAVVYSSKVTYSENERVARLQEGGRAALEMILRDLRAAGYRGCAQEVPFANALNAAGDLLWDFGTPVQGYESVGANWSPALDALIVSPRAGSDAIAARTMRAGMPVFRLNAAMADESAPMTIDKAPAQTLPAGRTVLISDCNAAAVFGVSAFADAGTEATVLHEAGGGVAGVGPGNATGALGFPFQEGAQIVPLDTVIYYIRDSDTVRDGVRNPSLWRIVGAGQPEELFEGVEGLQILYGVDTNRDRLVDDYVAADAVVNWNRVISVSLAMLFRSVEPNALQTDEREYNLLGTVLGPFNDRYQRALFSTTVTLRNGTS